MISSPPEPAKEEYISDIPFSKDEIRALRKILKTQDRMSWFWSTVRIWFMWAVAILTAFIALKQFLIDLIKSFK